MKQIRLQLPDSPTKAEEIAFLEKLSTYFGVRPNTYLSDLFTVELTEQLAWRIKNDMPCNVVESPIGSLFGH